MCSPSLCLMCLFVLGRQSGEFLTVDRCKVTPGTRYQDDIIPDPVIGVRVCLCVCVCVCVCVCLCVFPATRHLCPLLLSVFSDVTVCLVFAGLTTSSSPAPQTPSLLLVSCLTSLCLSTLRLPVVETQKRRISWYTQRQAQSKSTIIHYGSTELGP